MARREFTAAVKVARFKHCGRKCEGCGAHLTVGKFAYDHDDADGLTGKPTFENCRVLCLGCHSVKTRTIDIPRIAKAKRREARHLGAKAKSSRPMPGSKASGIRKRMDGTVEWRT